MAPLFITPKLLSDLIEINEASRNDCDKIAISPIQYLKEYCTINFFVGRQRGHTTAAIELFNNDDYNNIFIFHTAKMAADMHNKFSITNFTDKDTILERLLVYHRYYIIDLAFMWNSHEKDKLYEKIAALKEKETTIIFLQ